SPADCVQSDFGELGETLTILFAPSGKNAEQNIGVSVCSLACADFEEVSAVVLPRLTANVSPITREGAAQKSSTAFLLCQTVTDEVRSFALFFGLIADERSQSPAEKKKKKTPPRKLELSSS